MNPEIQPEQLQLIEDYLNSIATPEFMQRYSGRYLSNDETDKISAAVDLILLYGHNRFDGAAKPGEATYGHMRRASADDPFMMRDIVVNQTDKIRYLIEDYREHQAQEIKDKLFKKKISEMNGYEFQDYLRQIGVIK